MLPQKISKKHLLEYAESIGGKDLYMKMHRALEGSGVASQSELNERQLNNVITKLTEEKDFTLGRSKVEKLIESKERRRLAYIKMAIEEETDREEYGTGSRGGRYDRRSSIHERKEGGPHTSALRSASSSISRIHESKNSSGGSSRPASSGPTTSIAHNKK